MTTYKSIDQLIYPKRQEDRGYIDIFRRLLEIDEILKFISNLPVIPSTQEAIKKEEKIKAIRGTTGIEGNVLEEEEIARLLDKKGAKSLGEIEAINSSKVHDFIIEWSLGNPESPISEPLIKQIHKYNTQDLPYPSNKPGQYRNFEVTYGHPPKKTPLKTLSEIEHEMRMLIDWINDEKSIDFIYLPWLVKGLLSHYALSRIHPFPDGNGRTARALEALIFFHKANISDYCFYGIANYCYRHRDTYIEELSKVDISGDATDFLIFCLNGFHESINIVKDRISNIISELIFMDYVHDLRRSKKLSKKAVEAIDLIVKLKVMTLSEYYKRYLTDRSDESKRRYLKKFDEFRLVKIIEKDGTKYIRPNLNVLKTLRRFV